MTSILERLDNLYGGDDKNKSTGKSWIPHRPFSRDPVERFKEEVELKKETEEDDSETSALEAEAIEEIFFQVEDLFKSRHGDGPAYESRMCNFTMSWNSQYKRHGLLLVWAIGELTEEMNFVNQAGFIRLDLVKKQIGEIEKRRRKH